MRHLLRSSCAAAAASLFAALHCAEAATFVVTTTADAGTGSLRQAVRDAGVNPGDDIIVFDLPGPGPHFIDLLSSISISTNVEVLNGGGEGATEAVTVQRSFAPGTPDFSLLSVNATRVVIAGVTLRNGRSVGTGIAAWGGAIQVRGRTDLTVRDCVMSGNTAPSGGAIGIYANNGTSGQIDLTVRLLRCDVVGNTGGAVYMEADFAYATVTAEQCVFRDNAGGALGVRIGAGSGFFQLTDCSLTGNTAAQGGAVLVEAGGGTGRAGVSMNRCTLSGNSATSGKGGAILLASGSPLGQSTSADLENCTLDGNEAETGGAIDNDAGARLTLRNVTITGNRARSGGGGGVTCGGFASSSVGEPPNPHGTCQLWNSIVAANTSAGGGPDVDGEYFVSRGHNLIGAADGSHNSFVHGQNGDQAGSAAAPIDARLGPLRDNGGPTLTRALLAGSPALNAGNDATAPPRDQRGVARRGRADIGAYEFRPLTRAELTRDGQSDIIWQNNATGQRAIWQMNGTQWTGERFLPVIPTEWQIATSGDFNGDGHTDLVWQHTGNGARAIWLMNGTEWVGERFLPTISVQWRIAGSGDFDGDGHTDLLWQNNQTGDRAVWLMKGTQWVGERFLPRVALEWIIAAVDEFTGDTQLDILWQNVVTGQLAVWGMNGTQWVSEHFLPTVTTEWRIAGSGDFNGDGYADLVWQNNTTGQRAIWRMNGTYWAGESFLPTIPLEWQMRNH